MAHVLDSLGDPDIFATAMAPFCLWLWVRGLTGTLKGFIAGLAVVGAATLMLKWAVATPDAALWPDGTLISQYFPSGHAAMATAVYGSLAVLLAAAGGGAWRYAPFAALLLSIAVAAARVVLRMHPIGDAFFGVLLGLASPIVTYLAVVREREKLPPASRILAVFVIAIAAGWLFPAPLHDMLR